MICTPLGLHTHSAACGERELERKFVLAATGWYGQGRYSFVTEVSGETVLQEQGR